MPDRKVFIGGGGSVSLAAVGLFASGWPEHIRSHPWGVGGIALAGVILMVYGFFTPSKKADEGHSSQSAVGSGNIAARDISGKVITHVGNYYEAPPAAPIPHVEKPRNKPMPKLLIGLPATPPVYWTHASWSAAPPGTYGAMVGALVRIYQPSAGEGEKTPYVGSAVASVTYLKDEQIIASVPTAYWLEAPGYEVEFKAGQHRDVLLGVFPVGLSTPVWNVPENSLRQLPSFIGSSHSTGYKMVQFRIPDTIEVSIVDGRTTIKKFLMHVEMSPTACKLTMVQNDEA
jgi:hypothetical protein